MTDNEIIKALECCANNNGCHNCAFKKHATCFSVQEKSIYDLIHRQQAEIEKLKIENQSLRSAANSYKLHYNEARTEAVKEFAEKLTELYSDENVTDDMKCPVGVIKANIQDILEEIVGDTE